MRGDAVTRRKSAGRVMYETGVQLQEKVKEQAAHIAALEKERDENASIAVDAVRDREAALADNAALVEHARTERQMLSLLYHRIMAMGPRNEAMADAVTTVERWMDAVPDTYEQPHPGAALLEEHRKALVRARNEGLEKAAAWFRLKAKNRLAPLSNLNVAKAIDAMKEPESD